MRKLTISRQAIGMYGTYWTLKIYVDDNSGSHDTTIKGIPCRLLGKINAGEAQTFEIDEGQHRVFAVMGAASRNYKYDYRDIEAGCDDVYLSGKSVCDHSSGYLFYFDGETSLDVQEDLIKYRNRVMGWSFGIAIAIGLLVFGVSMLLRLLL